MRILAVNGSVWWVSCGYIFFNNFNIVLTDKFCYPGAQRRDRHDYSGEDNPRCRNPILSVLVNRWLDYGKSFILKKQNKKKNDILKMSVI